MFIFYLQRPVHTLKKDLANELVNPEGSKQRVLVSDRETVKLLGLESYLTEGSDNFVVLSNIDEPGWKQLLDTVAKQKRTDEE